MPKIIIASKNPVKIKASLQAFQRLFPGQTFETEGVSVPSGVKDQPNSDHESFQGAKNRAENASQTQPEADFWVGLEGGIEDKNGEMESFAWIVVKDKQGYFGKGKTGTFFLPPQVRELILQGKELGDADDIVFGKSNSKQENGAIGILTGDAIDRTSFYTEATILALLPFKNRMLYPGA